MPGSCTELRAEALQLYRALRRSLEAGTATYLIDDYLSGCENLTRNPTRSGFNVSYFSARGSGNKVLLFLLKTHENCLNPDAASNRNDGLEHTNPPYLVAEELACATLAMRMVSSSYRESGCDVSLIVFGGPIRQLGHEYISTKVLNEALLCDKGLADKENHLIVVEPTGLRLCNVQKGCLTFKLTVNGTSHDSSYSWLGDNPLDALRGFQSGLDDLTKPRHALYPVEFGKAPPSTISNFLIGYPAAATEQVTSKRSSAIDAKSVVESHHHVSIPPDFSRQELMKKLVNLTKEVEKSSGCQLSIEETYAEEPFREDPHSPLVEAICSAVKEATGFEPIFEWLPFAVSARELKESGFARDVVAFGPGDWAPLNRPEEKSIVKEILQAARILAGIPYEITASKKR